MRLFIGHVKEIDDNQIIKFIIDDMYTDTSEMPQAVPLLRLTKIAQVDDEVMIYQPNESIELFYYTQFRDKYEYVSLEYNQNFIRVFKNGNIVVETSDEGEEPVGNISVITRKKGDISIDTSNSESGNLNINLSASKGDLTIDSSGAGSGKVNIKTKGDITVESQGKVKIDAKEVEIPCSTVQLEGMSTIGFLPLTVITHPGGTVSPVDTAPCTALKVKK